jgi:hypothetical protein
MQPQANSMRKKRKMRMRMRMTKWKKRMKQPWLEAVVRQQQEIFEVVDKVAWVLVDEPFGSVM